MNSPTRPFLMGSETEYSVSMKPTERQRCRPAEVLASLVTQAARHELRCLRDATYADGVFLENGGRLYNDIHGHPEYCTPECESPEQVAAYDKAGELILLRLARRVKEKESIEITVTKNNLTSILPDSATFGNHESYLCWTDLQRAAQALIPHLVTRLPYAGAGCLSPHAQGWGFELSQRARHLVRETGPETTGNRAIFCTRIRKVTDSADGWTRCHLIAKDSQRAPLGIYLTFGTTGLLFWILNHGGVLGRSLTLTHPVMSLRTVSLDPWLKTRLPLVDGRMLTALEIQESYWHDCQTFAAQHELPPWGYTVLQRWREVLDALARHPLDLATRLDSYAKLFILQHEVQRAGWKWEEVRGALHVLDELRRTVQARVLLAAIREQSQNLPAQLRSEYEKAMATIGAAGPRMLEALRFVLRLQVLDLKYHELGGIYDQLTESGEFDNDGLQSAEILHAVDHAPAGGRAAIRGRLVREHSEQMDWCADWGYLMQNRTGKIIDLHNPFVKDSDELPTSETPSAASSLRNRDRWLSWMSF